MEDHFFAARNSSEREITTSEYDGLLQKGSGPETVEGDFVDSQGFILRLRGVRAPGGYQCRITCVVPAELVRGLG